MQRVLVTGGYGYIGSHIVKAAYEAGYHVDVIDKCRSKNDIEPYCDIISIEKIESINEYSKILFEGYDAVIHCAGLISVAESMLKPVEYYCTNTYGTLNLIKNLNFKHFIFASTGGAFDPISPYAKSKILAETMIKDTCNDYTIFRFFNVAGNNGEFSQICDPSHIIHKAAMTAVGKQNHMTIFGNDYDTKDGTCVRDYVHVQDLADAIVRSINEPANTNYECIGSGSGYTNLEVIEKMKEASGVDFPIQFGDRRDGDPARLIVDKQSRFVRIEKTLLEMCKSAYEMELAA